MTSYIEGSLITRELHDIMHQFADETRFEETFPRDYEHHEVFGGRRRALPRVRRQQ
jgi:hypothetical protein